MEEIVMKVGPTQAGQRQEKNNSRELLDKLERLQKEIASLIRANQMAGVQAEAFEKRLQEVELNALRKADAAEEDRREQELFRLANRIQELEKNMAELAEEKQDMAFGQHNSSVVNHPLANGNPFADQPPHLSAAESISTNLLAGLQQGSESHAALTAEEQLSPVPPGFDDTLQLRKLDILSTGAAGTRRVQHGQPFKIRLWLDFSNMKMSTTRPCSYQAVIHAKGLNGGSCREVIAKVEDTFIPAATGPLDLVARAMSPGFYRLHAVLTVNNEEKNHAPHTSSQDGGILYVY